MVTDRRGGAAIEFALVAPIFLAIVLLTIQGGIVLQQSNAMHTVGGVVARCIAIASPRCTGPEGSLPDPAVAYAVATAKNYGVGSITADMVTIDSFESAGNVSYSQVKLEMPVTMLGATITLRSTSRFPKV